MTHTSSHALLTQHSGYLSLLPQSLFHSSQFCHFSSFTIKASAFQSLPVCNHSPPSFHPPFCPSRRTSTPSRCSSQCVFTPLAVSSTLRGLAGEKRQPAGGGPGPARACCHPTESLAPASGSLLWLSVDIPFREGQ